MVSITTVILFLTTLLAWQVVAAANDGDLNEHVWNGVPEELATKRGEVTSISSTDGPFLGLVWKEIVRWMSDTVELPTLETVEDYEPYFCTCTPKMSTTLEFIEATSSAEPKTNIIYLVVKAKLRSTNVAFNILQQSSDNAFVKVPVRYLFNGDDVVELHLEIPDLTRIWSSKCLVLINDFKVTKLSSPERSILWENTETPGDAETIANAFWDIVEDEMDDIFYSGMIAAIAKRTTAKFICPSEKFTKSIEKYQEDWKYSPKHERMCQVDITNN